MHRIMFGILALALALPSAAVQPSASTTSPALSADDQTAVLGLVNGFADAWNRHDMKAMHDLDTDDVEWVNVVGDQWRGIDTVRKGHTAIHKGMDATTTMRVQSTTIHRIDPDVAVVVAILHFIKSTRDTKTRGSFTAVRRNGLWKIAQFQNTVVDPEAEKYDVPSYAATGFFPSSHP